jgi:hypothetical protein
MTLAELNALIDANVPSGARPKIKATELRDVLHEMAAFSETGSGFDDANYLRVDGTHTATGNILFANNRGIQRGGSSIIFQDAAGANLEITGDGNIDIVAADHLLLEGGIDLSIATPMIQVLSNESVFYAQDQMHLSVAYGGTFDITLDNGDFQSAWIYGDQGKMQMGFLINNYITVSDKSSDGIVLHNDIGAINMNSAGGLKLTDSRAGASQVGWESGGDYSAYYTDRSFPDWGSVKIYADTKVKLSTGDVLFKFNSSNSFDITNDGNGGDYSKNYLYMSSVEIDLGFNDKYVGVTNSALFFKQGAYTVTVPTGVNGTVALSSDVSLKVSKSGDTMSGNLLFSGGSSIDTTATGGTDTLNIGTTNADVINIGNASTVLNFLGTAIFEYQANQYVTDKLVTLNYGGSVASGIGVGYEIEENGVITGYFKSNGTRTGYSFKSPANAGVLNLITIGADVDLTAGNSGTIAVVSDISWSNLTGKPTTIAGYGITDPIVLTSGSYANPSWITSLAWSKLTGVPSYEPALGNPGVDGYALISTAAGVRSWTPFPSTSPLTTKGDIYTFDSVNQRLPVGANGYLLSADSSASTGLAWIPNVLVVYPFYNEGPTNKTYTIDAKVTTAGAFTQIRGLATASGTCTIAIKINGTAVTFTGSVTTLNVSSTPQDVSIISGGSIAAGDRITYTITSAAAPVDLEATLK